MTYQTNVIGYKCPCCNAGLKFGSNVQKLKCEYCDSEFVLDTVIAFNESDSKTDSVEFDWQSTPEQTFTADEEAGMSSFICPSCGGEILTDGTAAATFCPYCDNPTIMPARLDGMLKPDAVIPFQKSKEDAQAAFLNLCKGKPLLPKSFTSRQQLEKITGMYVPFWLYDCSGQINGSYKATRVSRWSDSKYHYTKTDHYLLSRNAGASFSGIPMDGSSKMDDTFMESIEPYDYSALTPFHTAYLSGYLADKYDVEAKAGEERIRSRVGKALDEQLESTFIGYASVVPTSKQLQVQQSNARYVLLPVWMLNTRYEGKLYTFAMNGQTGKMTGKLPICKKRRAAWFFGIAAVVSALSFLFQYLPL